MAGNTFCWLTPPLQTILVTTTGSRTSDLPRTIEQLFWASVGDSRHNTFVASVKLPRETLWWRIPSRWRLAGRLLPTAGNSINSTTAKHSFVFESSFDHGTKPPQRCCPWAHAIIEVELLTPIHGCLS